MKYIKAFWKTFKLYSFNLWLITLCVSLILLGIGVLISPFSKVLINIAMIMLGIVLITMLIYLLKCCFIDFAKEYKKNLN